MSVDEKGFTRRDIAPPPGPPSPVYKQPSGFVVFILPLIILLVLGVGIWYFTGDPKNEVCLASHYEQRHGIISTGKITIPTTREVQVCDVWATFTAGPERMTR